MCSIVSVVSTGKIFTEYAAVFPLCGSKKIFDVFCGLSNFDQIDCQSRSVVVVILIELTLSSLRSMGLLVVCEMEESVSDLSIEGEATVLVSNFRLLHVGQLSWCALLTSFLATISF